MNANKIILNDEVLIDLTQDTATEEDVAKGKTFHKADGSVGVGTASGGASCTSGTPIVVETATEMDEILANATDDNIGIFYRYIGETTENYINNTLYAISKKED